MSTDSVTVEVMDGWTKIALNRPDKLNCLTQEMHRKLFSALKNASDDDACGVVLLTGSANVFCAGQDLSEYRPHANKPAPDLGVVLDQFYNPLVMLLRTMRKPVICSVNGVAAGAGANIALACDIVLAAASAKFIQSFCKIGLIPDAGGTYTLPRLVGAARARAMMLLGEPVGADQAQQWGLVWKVYPDSDLSAQSEALAEHLARQPTAIMASIKRLLNASTGNSFEAQLDMERDIQRDAGFALEYAEGIEAFFDRRAPNYRQF